MSTVAVAFYARVSSEQQVQSHTIASQVAALRDYITQANEALSPATANRFKVVFRVEESPFPSTPVGEDPIMQDCGRRISPTSARLSGMAFARNHLKHIADAQLAERLPGIVRLLRELSEKQTLLDYLETLLRYPTTATDKLSERDIGQALNEVLPVLEEKFMPTLAEKWLEQGRQEARAEMPTLVQKWLETGERRVLLRQLELRFGSLPEEYRERIATADPDALLVWSERVLSAHQLEEIFAP